MYESANNKYLFEAHLSEKARLYISLINQCYARYQNYMKYKDAAVHPIDREKGLKECKRITLEDIKYYLEKLKEELNEENFKHYSNYNYIIISEVEDGLKI